jgi:hypothetical protein
LVVAVFLRFRLPPGSTNGLFGAVVLACGLFGGLTAVPMWLTALRLPLGATWAMRLVGPGEEAWRALMIGFTLGVAWLLAGTTAVIVAERGTRKRADAFAE